MPILKCAASKATPAKGIAYILNRDKTLYAGAQNLMDYPDGALMAQQMMRTMRVHGKGNDPSERKYYHAKVSFDPRDLAGNGGSLTAEKAQQFAQEFAEKTWQGREVVWSVQHHGEAMHIHFIIAACDLDTGRKLDARTAVYQSWKDGANDLAAEMGLSTLDWRKATREKRQREARPAAPVVETFAEQGLKSRGKRTWKDELRAKIDSALASSSSMEEFRAALLNAGVDLTRCTAQTISYRLQGHERGCRGDTLGARYTSEAIRDALARNRNSLEGQHQRLIDQMDSAANYFPRPSAEEWEFYRRASSEFWGLRADLLERYDSELDDAWEHRLDLRSSYEDAMYALRRSRNIFSVLINAGWALFIVFRQMKAEDKIDELKAERRQLMQNTATFARYSKVYKKDVQEGKLPYIGYMEIMADIVRDVDRAADRFRPSSERRHRDR